MVRQRHRRHPLRPDPLHQVGDLALSVEQAVMAVAMEVNEGRCGHREFTLMSLRYGSDSPSP